MATVEVPLPFGAAAFFGGQGRYRTRTVFDSRSNAATCCRFCLLHSNPAHARAFASYQMRAMARFCLHPNPATWRYLPHIKCCTCATLTPFKSRACARIASIQIPAMAGICLHSKRAMWRVLPPYEYFGVTAFFFIDQVVSPQNIVVCDCVQALFGYILGVCPKN